MLTAAEIFRDSYHNVTTLNWMGGLATIIMGTLLLVLPRRQAMLPVIALVCLIPSAQRIVIFELDFTLLRIMVLVGFVRILTRKEYRGLERSVPDVVIIAWAIFRWVAYSLTFMSGAASTAISGFIFDALGIYFLGRCLIRNLGDVNRLAMGFAILSVPVAAAFVREKLTGQNVFSIFGGVPALTAIREGKLRCQGAFSHPILAGCFWAATMPLMGALLWGRGTRKAMAVLGCLCGTIVIFMCASSTPLASLVFGIVGACFYGLRHRMRIIRYGVVVTLVVLHLVMTMPVWHLISRLDFVGGSTGWHRYHLIDQFINRVGEWALIGTRSTAHWGYGMFDTTNHYVVEGVQGGLLTLTLFFVIIGLAFSRCGWIWRRHARNRQNLAMSWALGVSLSVHCASFIAISYFGQIIFIWYALLGAIVSIGEGAKHSRKVPQGETLGAPRRLPAPTPASRRRAANVPCRQDVKPERRPQSR